MNGVHTDGRNVARGFTLVALLSIIGITTLLASVFTTTVRNARAKQIQLKCAQNLRQIGVAAQMYADAERLGRFPDLTGAFWPWDVPGPVANSLIHHGATRDVFYCPGVPEQNSDALWNFTAGVAGTNGFRVTGYAFAFKGAGRVRATNVTESLAPIPYRIGTTEVQPPPSARVVSADATLSVGSNERDRAMNRYTRIYGGYASPHRSPHLRGKLPAGGNLVFLDGHTEWKPFKEMRVRTEGDPTFWW